MRNLILLFSLVSLISLYSCNGKKSNQESATTAPVKVALQTYKYAVEGMTCTGCEQTVQNSVKKLEGVDIVTASHTGKTAMVSFDPAKTDTAKIREAIASTGYTVLGIEKTED